MGDLTNKQKAFIEEYLKCWNATDAARKAGYSGDDNALASAGSRLLRNAKVREKVQQRLKSKAMEADEVLSLLSQQARGNMADFLDLTLRGGKLDLKKADELGLLHLVKKVSWTKQGTTIELYNSQAALDKLAKALGLFTERHVNLDIDMENLSTEQLARIAAGENPLHVIGDKPD